MINILDSIKMETQNKIQERQTAYMVTVAQLIGCRYVKEEGWKPNYAEINKKKISRVNILATVISKETEQQSATVDDGTGSIQLRTFDNPLIFSNIHIGDIALIIGRPREFNEKIYLIPEIIRRIDNPLWIKHRQILLTIQKEEENQTPHEKITELISSLDKGNGADIEDIIKNSKIENAETIIRSMLREGEIFETKPGVVKILN